MSEKVVIQTDTAPAPIGPYTQAIKHGDMVFLSGQIALDPKTSRLVGADAAAQADQILNNIEAILKFSGLNMFNIVRCTLYVIDLAEMPAVNKVYSKYFVYEPPVRTTVQVAALPAGARIEIEATAMFTPRKQAPAAMI